MEASYLEQEAKARHEKGESMESICAALKIKRPHLEEMLLRDSGPKRKRGRPKAILSQAILSQEELTALKAFCTRFVIRLVDVDDMGEDERRQRRTAMKDSVRIEALEAAIDRMTEQAKVQAKLDGLTITNALNDLEVARQRYKEAEAKLEQIYRLSC